IAALARTDCEDAALGPLYEAAIRDTLERFEAAGSPVVSDGEQRKYYNFATYPVHGQANMAADGFRIAFADGRSRRMPPLTAGALLASLVDLNNLALARFSPQERRRIGVHTCPGGDLRSPHSAEVDYADLLPRLFELNAGHFYVALACERDRGRALQVMRKCLKANQRIFIGVTSPTDPRTETAEEVRDLVLLASEHIPAEQLGTTDDCGFAPFSDDTTRTRDLAFAKIGARLRGTQL